VDSIEAWVNDEIIVEFDIPRQSKWGNPQRNKGILRAKGDYLVFIDDDDFYVKGHRELMDQAINENPDVPIMFQMQYPNGETLWKYKALIPGNVSTPMMLVPNKPEMLHIWEGGRNMADFIFMDKWKWPKESIVWRKEVIALLGHDGANYGK
jgi:glycosyltransferase involved in cell wall biosynthesis